MRYLDFAYEFWRYIYTKVSNYPETTHSIWQKPYFQTYVADLKA